MDDGRPSNDRQRHRPNASGQAHQRGCLGRHGAVVFEHEPAGGPSNEHKRAPSTVSPSKRLRRPRLTPGRGTFHFENLVMPPLTKTCPKMVLFHKGGSVGVKDAFAKKFFGAGRDSAGGALASVLRKHSTGGRTSDAVERCVRHCAGSRPRDRDLPPRFRTIQVYPRTWGCFRGSLSVR